MRAFPGISKTLREVFFSLIFENFLLFVSLLHFILFPESREFSVDEFALRLIEYFEVSQKFFFFFLKHIVQHVLLYWSHVFVYRFHLSNKNILHKKNLVFNFYAENIATTYCETMPLGRAFILLRGLQHFILAIQLLF